MHSLFWDGNQATFYWLQGREHPQEKERVANCSNLISCFDYSHILLLETVVKFLFINHVYFIREMTQRSARSFSTCAIIFSVVKLYCSNLGVKPGVINWPCDNFTQINPRLNIFSPLLNPKYYNS